MATTSDAAVPAGGGAAFVPELQMANTLGLCEAQMESALRESDQAVEALIKAFTCLVDTTRAVGAVTETLPPEIRDRVAGDLERHLDALSKQMGTAVMAFQFYDKLTQRLGHVRYSLSTLALFVCDRTQSNQPDQWKRLLQTLRRLYRTEEERQIFGMIMDGVEAPAAEPLAREETQAGEVELF